MIIQEEILLAPLTTFRVGGPARYFAEVTTEEELKEAVYFARVKGVPFFVLGGGSNVLISDSGFPGIIIKISLKGISVKEEGENIFVTAKAGESWDDLVAYSVARGWRGLQNLSGIPGSVGAAPIQNIGAYGAEARDTIESVSAYDLESEEIKNFANSECGFAYRNSFFKTPAGKKFIILSVTFRLSKSSPLNFAYRGMEEYFRENNIAGADITPSVLRNAVLSIRESKLPSSVKIGTAGSFFKNPIISKSNLAELLRRFPNTPYFEEPEKMVKIPAGYLIERAGGFKGERRGEAGVYEKHALVLVNYGSASAKEINDFSEEIISSVEKSIGIRLEKEVNLVGEF